MRFVRAALLAPVVIVISGFGAGPGSTTSPFAQHPAEVVVHLDRSIGTIDPLIYGHLTEETLTSWEGGVSSEMLVDRKFSVPEERFPFSGTGGGWEPIELASTVTLVQDQVVYYSAPMSQRISNAGGTVPAGVQQRGYRMTPPQMSRQAPSGGVQVVSQRTPEPFHFRTGEHFRARIAIKNRDLNGAVFVAIGEDYKHTAAKHAIDLAGGEDWKVYQFELAATADANDAKFMIFTESRGTVWVDSASLVRSDLDEGGFRKDVLEATRRLRPRMCAGREDGLFPIITGRTGLGQWTSAVRRRIALGAAITTTTSAWMST
jgi:hypothetical protein